MLEQLFPNNTKNSDPKNSNSPFFSASFRTSHRSSSPKIDQDGSKPEKNDENLTRLSKREQIALRIRKFEQNITVFDENLRKSLQNIQKTTSSQESNIDQYIIFENDLFLAKKHLQDIETHQRCVEDFFNSVEVLMHNAIITLGTKMQFCAQKAELELEYNSEYLDFRAKKSLANLNQTFSETSATLSALKVQISTNLQNLEIQTKKSKEILESFEKLKQKFGKFPTLSFEIAKILESFLFFEGISIVEQEIALLLNAESLTNQEHEKNFQNFCEIFKRKTKEVFQKLNSSFREELKVKNQKLENFKQEIKKFSKFIKKLPEEQTSLTENDKKINDLSEFITYKEKQSKIRRFAALLKKNQERIKKIEELLVTQSPIIDKIDENEGYDEFFEYQKKFEKNAENLNPKIVHAEILELGMEILLLREKSFKKSNKKLQILLNTSKNDEISIKNAENNVKMKKEELENERNMIDSTKKHAEKIFATFSHKNPKRLRSTIDEIHEIFDRNEGLCEALSMIDDMVKEILKTLHLNLKEKHHDTVFSLSEQLKMRNFEEKEQIKESFQKEIENFGKLAANNAVSRSEIMKRKNEMDEVRDLYVDCKNQIQGHEYNYEQSQQKFGELQVKREEFVFCGFYAGLNLRQMQIPKPEQKYSVANQNILIQNPTLLNPNSNQTPKQEHKDLKRPRELFEIQNPAPSPPDPQNAEKKRRTESKEDAKRHEDVLVIEDSDDEE